MKNLLILIALLASFSLSAQTGKGASPIPNSEIPNPKSTRAVVVGISDYQDDKIPDLKYAHRDALAFAAWLQSPAGGSVPPDHIQLLLEKEATKGKVAMALDWLMDKSAEGDRAIIYFSGHGDVEKKLFSQPGYLLCRDAPPVVYMSGGALSVTELQEVVATLSLVKKAEVLVVTDACRAGALAGAATGGPQQTTASLQQQFAKEVKILSCQSNEYSIESEQWGGGRGAFSYVLEDALYGLADRDKDSQIRLKEIRRYLEDQVPAQTDPQIQNPVVVGDLEALITAVDEAALAQWEAEKKQRQAGFSPADSRGMEDVILAQADTGIQQIYQAFLAAVEAGELMSPKGKSANDYYEVLIHEPSIEQLHGFLKRNFVAALVDEAQQVTNKLLKTDPEVVSDTWSRPFVFDHIPGYLERAVEILGEKHFIYKQLKAKQYFFEAKTCLPDYFPDLSPDSVAWMAARKFEEALRYDSSAAYVHVEYGFLLWYKLMQQEVALRHALKALEFSPNWLYAQYFTGNAYRLLDPAKAIFHLEKAVALDPDFLPAYYEMSKVYLIHGDKKKAKSFSSMYIEKAFALIESNPENMPIIYRTYLGGMLWQEGRMEEAEKVLLYAVELSKGQDLATYQYLGTVYISLGQYEKALRMAKKQLELAPLNSESYLQAAVCYQALHQPFRTVEILEKALSLSNIAHRFHTLAFHVSLGEAYNELERGQEAKQQFQKILELIPYPSNAFEMNYVGRSHLGLGDLEAMQRTIDEGFQKFPDDVWTYYHAACLYSMAEDEQKSLEWLETALEKGFNDVGTMKSDPDLDWVREKPGFKALLKKYFPDQAKD